MTKIVAKIKAIKKRTSKRPRLLIVACLVGLLLIEGTTFAVIHTIKTFGSKPTVSTEKTTAGSPKPSPTKAVSPKPKPSPSQGAEPTPSQTTRSSQKSTSTKPKGWYWPTKETQECNQKMSDAYVKYNADLKAENARHQAALAALQYDYDNGGYNDPYPYGSPNDFYYQMDVDAENSQWNATITAINDTERAAMDALYPC